MSTTETVETVVVGAGHAGLAVSRLLIGRGPRPRRARARPRRRALAHRALGLGPPDQPELDAPAARDAVRRARTGLVPQRRRLRPPSRRGTRGRSARRCSTARPCCPSSTHPARAGPASGSRSDRGTWRAANVVVATGPYELPNVPTGLRLDVPVVPASSYRNPEHAGVRRRARRRRLGLRRADRRRAAPCRPGRDHRGRPAHPDAAALPRRRRLLLDGADRTAGPDHRRRGRSGRRPPRALAAARRGQRARTLGGRPRPRRPRGSRRARRRAAAGRRRVGGPFPARPAGHRRGGGRRDAALPRRGRRARGAGRRRPSRLARGPTGARGARRPRRSGSTCAPRGSARWCSQPASGHTSRGCACRSSPWAGPSGSAAA